MDVGMGADARVAWIENLGNKVFGTERNLSTAMGTARAVAVADFDRFNFLSRHMVNQYWQGRQHGRCCGWRQRRLVVSQYWLEHLRNWSVTVRVAAELRFRRRP